MGLLTCPPVLFIILGFVTIISILAASLLSMRYFTDPELPTILIVTFIAVLFLIVGNIIIEGFNKVTQANSLKTQFISIISHQIRSPLSIFKWTLDALDAAAQKEGKTETHTQPFNTMREAVERMIGLVDSLLDVIHVENHMFTLLKEEFLLQNELENLLGHIRNVSNPSAIKLNAHIDGLLPPIIADRKRIRRVMQDLLENALRYTPEKGSVEVELKRIGAFAELSIKDTGIGIPALQHRYVFQKFFRSSNGLQYQSEGTGVALYVAKAIIEKSGGRIGFTSEQGKGSLFWFTLPLIKEVPDPR